MNPVEGLIAAKSPFPAKQTMDRMEAQVRKRGLHVFARVDHAAGATSVGKSLRPTEMLMFGHAKGGTPFMECAQTVGIDLPLKALVWQDDDGQVWLGYDDPAYIARRHGAGDCPAVAGLSGVLQALAVATLAP